jgi:hypothetical protein
MTLHTLERLNEIVWALVVVALICGALVTT